MRCHILCTVLPATFSTSSTIARVCFDVSFDVSGVSEQCEVHVFHGSNALCIYHGIHAYWVVLSVQLIRELPLQKRCTFIQLAVVVATNVAYGCYTSSTNSARQVCLRWPFCCGFQGFFLIRRVITWKRLSGLDAHGALSCLQASALSLQSRALSV